MIVGDLAPEIAVEVLLGAEPGAPGRDAAGAIVEHADDLAAGRVGRGLQQRVAGGRAGDLHPVSDAVMRRLYLLSGTTCQRPSTFLTSMTEPPCAAISMSASSWVILREA